MCMNDWEHKRGNEERLRALRINFPSFWKRTKWPFSLKWNWCKKNQFHPYTKVLGWCSKWAPTIVGKTMLAFCGHCFPCYSEKAHFEPFHSDWNVAAITQFHFAQAGCFRASRIISLQLQPPCPCRSLPLRFLAHNIHRAAPQSLNIFEVIVQTVILISTFRYKLSNPSLDKIRQCGKKTID